MPSLHPQDPLGVLLDEVPSVEGRWYSLRARWPIGRVGLALIFCAGSLGQMPTLFEPIFEPELTGEGGLSLALAWGALVMLLVVVAFPAFLLFRTLAERRGYLWPRIVVRISPLTARPGEPLFVRWVMTGSVERIEQLTVRLEARRVLGVGLQQSRTAETDRTRPKLHDLPGAVVSDPARIREGILRLDLPGNLRSSYRSATRLISWQLVFEGRTARWPRLDREFSLKLRKPGRPAGPVRKRTRRLFRKRA